MSKQPQKPMFANGLYVALSLLVLALICIGTVSTVGRLTKDTKTDLPANDISADSLLPTVPEDDNDPPVSIPPTIEDTPVDVTPPEELPTVDEPEEAPRVFMSPLNTVEISKEYEIEELIYSQTMNDYRTHDGIDFSADVGAAVCAVTDGVIESIHPDPLMGQTVVIDHGDGLKSIYQNLALEMPSGIVAGVSVNAGDLIGAVGETALIECAEDNHLHFELQLNKCTVDPGEYLSLND